MLHLVGAMSDFSENIDMKRQTKAVLTVVPIVIVPLPPLALDEDRDLVHIVVMFDDVSTIRIRSAEIILFQC